LTRQDVQSAQVRQVLQKLAIGDSGERTDADHLGVNGLAAGLHDPRAELRNLPTGGHLALNLEPQALEV
jgi:hypothetical protein